VLTAVPEPSTMLLSLLGLAGLAWLGRRRVRSLRNRPGSCDAAGRVRI